MNRVILLLLVAALAGGAGLAFVGFAPNRILSAQPVSVWAAGPAVGLAAMSGGLVLMAAGALALGRRGDGLVLGGATLLFLAAFWQAGAAASGLLAGAVPAARVSLGGGFWVMAVAAALAVAEALRRLGAADWQAATYAAAVAAGLVAMALAGHFDDLSIAREFANRQGQFGAAVLQHLGLVGAALAVSLVIGVPLGVLAHDRPGAGGRIFAVLNIVQTIPSIALFGFLIGPLTALSDWLPWLRTVGIRGIGFAPALIALVLYALLPVVRNVVAGLGSVPAAVRDAATGMGMTAGQVLFRISLPLAMPVLFAGLRIVMVQTIGLTVVAALIGAGGLGTFVFLGLGQTANDLVLLGALTTILLALLADTVLRLSGRVLAPGAAR